jgi:hypothetical protein
MEEIGLKEIIILKNLAGDQSRKQGRNSPHHVHNAMDGVCKDAPGLLPQEAVKQTHTVG